MWVGIYQDVVRTYVIRKHAGTEALREIGWNMCCVGHYLLQNVRH